MKLYFKYAGIIIKSQMQYKASLIMSSIGQFLVSFTGFVSIFFLFKRFNQINAFTFTEVLLCYAIVLTAFSLAECFFRGFDTFSSIISNGEFDRIMVRPRNEIFQVLASRIELSRIGRLTQALLLFIYALPKSNISWSSTRALTIIFMIIGGVVVFSSLFIIYAGFCFFTIEGLEFMNIFTDGGREFGSYPYIIYGKGILKFLTYVIPLALFQYYPLLYLTGKTNNILYMFLPLLSSLFVIPSLAFWKTGIRHYKSTGS